MGTKRISFYVQRTLYRRFYVAKITRGGEIMLIEILFANVSNGTIKMTKKRIEENHLISNLYSVIRSNFPESDIDFRFWFSSTPSYETHYNGSKSCDCIVRKSSFNPTEAEILSSLEKLSSEHSFFADEDTIDSLYYGILSITEAIKSQDKPDYCFIISERYQSPGNGAFTFQHHDPSYWIRTPSDLMEVVKGKKTKNFPNVITDLSSKIPNFFYLIPEHYYYGAICSEYPRFDNRIACGLPWKDMDEIISTIICLTEGTIDITEITSSPIDNGTAIKLMYFPLPKHPVSRLIT